LTNLLIDPLNGLVFWAEDAYGEACYNSYSIGQKTAASLCVEGYSPNLLHVSPKGDEMLAAQWNKDRSLRAVGRIGVSQDGKLEWRGWTGPNLDHKVTSPRSQRMVVCSLSLYWEQIRNSTRYNRIDTSQRPAR
jgi:hypothetical protein